MKIKSNGRRAISPIIAALILSAVVIAVGGAVWAFSQGTMTITAEDYAEGVINMTETISERFIVEHVSYERYDPDPDILRIWIFNYGDVDIEVNVTYPENSNGWTKVSSKGLEEIPIDIVPGLSSKNELGIKVESSRGNDAYYRFVVP